MVIKIEIPKIFESALNKKPAFRIVAVAVIACVIVAVCFLSNPARQRDTLIWARELHADDVVSVDLVVFPQTEEKQFKALSEDEISGMAALINQSKGKYRAKYEEINGGSIFFYITMKDGQTHSVGNVGNVYLVIDGDYYEADYAWLNTWDDDFGEGNAPLRDDYFLDNPVSQDTVVWEDADLDHDGQPESIRVRENAEGEFYELRVVKEDGTLLWSTEAALAHAGWNTVLLYEENGEDYLIQYLPAMYQGMGSYSWTQFFLEGELPLEVDSMSVDFQLPLFEEDSALSDFAERTNRMMEDSTVLLSTEQGKLVTGPKAAADVPQIYPVQFDPNEE